MYETERLRAVYDDVWNPGFVVRREIAKFPLPDPADVYYHLFMDAVFP